jgi:hypothetical protein
MIDKASLIVRLRMITQFAATTNVLSASSIAPVLRSGIKSMSSNLSFAANRANFQSAQRSTSATSLKMARARFRCSDARPSSVDKLVS